MRLFGSLCFFLWMSCAFTYECIPGLTYKWPRARDCQSYYVCKNGVLSHDSCFILLRAFNRKTLRCDWFWNVDCSAVPVPPVGPTAAKPTEETTEIHSTVTYGTVPVDVEITTKAVTSTEWIGGKPTKAKSKPKPPNPTNPHNFDTSNFVYFEYMKEYVNRIFNEMYN